MIKRFYYIFFFILVFACNEAKIEKQAIEILYPEVELLGQLNKESLVSEPITVRYKSSILSKDIYLQVSNAISSVLIEPNFKSNSILSYSLDENFYNRVGRLKLNLIYKGQILDSNEINIKPLSKTVNIETYLGPTYITALPKDYAMLVTIPFDEYDNPNLSSLRYKKTLNNFESHIDHTELDIVNYDLIFSTRKTGKIFLNVYDNDFISKRLEVTVRPSFARDFTISYSQNNSVADGKELTVFKTSIIKDENENIVSNGSLVRFVVKDSIGRYFGYGKTINGIATFEMVHPSYPKSINVQAFVEGFAKSDSLQLSYKKNEF